MVLGREQGEHPTEPIPRVDVRVEEDDRLSRSISPFGIVQSQTRREVDRGELHAVRLVHHVPPLRRAFPDGSYAPYIMPLGEALRPAGGCLPKPPLFGSPKLS